MKKLFTILCAAILTLSVSAQAQFGVKAGLNIAAIGSSEGDSPNGSRIGMQLGGVATIPFGDVVQLRTGAIYSQKGASDSDLDGVIAMDYLEIPVDFAFMLGDGGFALSAGPYLGFLMAANIDGEDFLEYMNDMDMGLNFGTSFTIAESMIIDARYGMGLMDITGEDLSDGVDVNGALQISFAYMFGGGY